VDAIAEPFDSEPTAEVPAYPDEVRDDVTEPPTDKTAEVPAYADEVRDDVSERPTDEAAEVPAHAAEARDDVTEPPTDEAAEVPAYAAEAHGDVIESPPIETANRRAGFETPIYVTPASTPATDYLIDEVDAAFITAGLPATGEPTSAHAAAVLETIARRLRSGELALPSTSDSQLGSDEATLATVLAALLARR
jgi:hypothetical protein